MQDLFIDKLWKRFRQFEAEPSAARILSFADVFIPQGGLKGLVEKLCSDLKEALQRSNDEFIYFSHGNLCLSNILFDRHARKIKLVDPRGCLDMDQAFLPIYYDIAKLSHCFLGYYDFLMNKLASFDVNDQLEMQVHPTFSEDYLNKYSSVFRSWLIKNGYNYQLFRLCEASFFLSMLPLHLDKPAHVLKQILSGQKAHYDAIQTYARTTFYCTRGGKSSKSTA